MAEENRPRRDCLLFLSHHTRPGAMQALERLTKECGDAFDILPVFDQSGGSFSLDAIAPDALAVTAAMLEEALPYPRKNSQHPGTLWPNNIDLPLFWIFKERPHYARYWVIEYDVRFSGRWPDFFSAFEDNVSDLLAITVFDHGFRPSWGHWGSFDAPGAAPLEERVRATLSFYRLSNRALVVLDEAYRQGATGHYEVAIPTTLKRAGLKIEDIGGDGAYVAPGARNRFYLNSPAIPGLAPGTFVLHAEGMIRAPLANKLWNPFKD